MIRGVVVSLLVLVFGAGRAPFEAGLSQQHRTAFFREAELGLPLREQIGQLGFLAALSGFRSVVADFFFIQAHVAWEQTEWGRVLFLFRQATTLQPRSILFWDMAAWHMAWNASVAAMNDPHQPNDSLRRKAQEEYFHLGEDFLVRGIKNNPDRPQLYESLGRLQRDKLEDHLAAAESFHRAAALPGAPEYDHRFSAYELSRAPGHEREAYRQLREIYDRGENERLPTLLTRLRAMEEKLNVPASERIPPNEKPHPVGARPK